jgi:hypothetical protein
MCKKVILSLALAFLLATCADPALDLKIKWDQVRGLTKDDRVLLEENQVGRVTDVVYSRQGNYLVGIKIRAEFVNALTDRCKFFVIPDPRNNQKMAVEIILTAKGGKPLEDGATIQGAVKPPDLSKDMKGRFLKGMTDLKSRFETFADELRKIPRTDEFKKLENDFKSLSEELKRSGKSVKDKIEKDVLPRLRKELEDLRKRLPDFEPGEKRPQGGVETEKTRGI